jgi:Adaptin C-terminal domain
LARFKNTSNFDRLNGVGLQAAVPKSQKLTLQAINRSMLEAGEEATQAMKVVGATGVSQIASPRGAAPVQSFSPQRAGLTFFLHRRFPQSSG